MRLLSFAWVRIRVLAFATFAAAAGAADSGVATEARFLSHTRQLIFEGRRSGEGYFSPDGKALIFQSERELGNPFYQIYTLDLETGDTARVSTGIGKTTCAFFRPGSDEVLFSSTTHHGHGVRCGGFVLARREADRFLLAAGRLPHEQTYGR
ncbi:MAG: hypothetical protein NT154_23055 [Verrucomicrobia bacterium]|nr:hypothetical protein [Verrucomicrobiota bacterium]